MQISNMSTPIAPESEEPVHEQYYVPQTKPEVQKELHNVPKVQEVQAPLPEPAINSNRKFVYGDGLKYLYLKVREMAIEAHSFGGIVRGSFCRDIVSRVMVNDFGSRDDEIEVTCVELLFPSVDEMRNFMESCKNLVSIAYPSSYTRAYRESMRLLVTKPVHTLSLIDTFGDHIVPVIVTCSKPRDFCKIDSLYFDPIQGRLLCTEQYSLSDVLNQFRNRTVVLKEDLVAIASVDWMIGLNEKLYFYLNYGITDKWNFIDHIGRRLTVTFPVDSTAIFAYDGFDYNSFTNRWSMALKQ